VSTRCNIEFREIYNYKLKNGEPKKREETRMIYRHSDGYPEGVVPDLKEFLKWNGGRNTDLEYMTANFIYWSKRYHEEMLYDTKYGGGQDEKGNKIKWSDPQQYNSALLLGFGICEKNGFHGDIEYFYEVVVETGEGIFPKAIKITIKVYKVKFEKKIKRGNFELIDTIVVRGEEVK